MLIRLRADSGFARPLLYEGCERLGVEYSIGLGMNPVLKRKSEELLQTAVKAYEETGEPQRLFTGFEYQVDTWPASRWVTVKCEANARGTNRRAVVTNRPGARTLPQTYFPWVTDLTITKENVLHLVAGGRARWKIEHEAFNMLKNQGYHFEHNYGHGQQNLSVDARAFCSDAA